MGQSGIDSHNLWIPGAEIGFRCCDVTPLAAGACDGGGRWNSGRTVAQAECRCAQTGEAVVSTAYTASGRRWTIGGKAINANGCTNRINISARSSRWTSQRGSISDHSVWFKASGQKTFLFTEFKFVKFQRNDSLSLHALNVFGVRHATPDIEPHTLQSCASESINNWLQIAYRR